jgi:hypothetical protein
VQLALLAGLALAVAVAGCGPAARHLAIANGNHLRVVDANSGQEDHHVTRYQEILHLAYRPDGERLAVDLCFGNRIAELEASGYTEVASPITASSCPWAVTYSPDGHRTDGHAGERAGCVRLWRVLDAARLRHQPAGRPRVSGDAQRTSARG